MKQGFSVIGRNYNKPWGEIDIIAQKSDLLCFVEVKTVSRETNRSVPPKTRSFVSGETNMRLFHRICRFLRQKFLVGPDSYDVREVSPETNHYVSGETGYRPEDNLHPWKLSRIQKTIQSYLAEKGIDEESDWRFDAICVYLNEKDKTAEVEWLQNIIL